jgi:hypothetical protein
MNKIKLHRKYLALGHDKNLPNPLSQEHEWLFRTVNNYDIQSKINIYKCITDSTDYYKVRQQFMISILKDCNTYYDINKFKNAHSSIQDAIELWQKDMVQKETVELISVPQSEAVALSGAPWSVVCAIDLSKTAKAGLLAESARAALISLAWSVVESAEKPAVSATMTMASAIRIAHSAAMSVAREKQAVLITRLIKEYS